MSKDTLKKLHEDLKEPQAFYNDVTGDGHVAVTAPSKADAAELLWRRLCKFLPPVFRCVTDKRKLIKILSVGYIKADRDEVVIFWGDGFKNEYPVYILKIT